MSDLLFTWLLYCWGAVLYQGIETRIHIIDERRNWWEAQSRCKDNGRMLYTPGTDDIPADLWKSLQSPNNYWIGAMRYWAWKWTVDYSPLFSYAGFFPLGSVTVEPKGTYLDNSVWKCHLHCSPAYSVGMKGTTCYCLEEGYNTAMSMLPEDTCPGNLEERCGNIRGMSVFKLGAKTSIYCGRQKSWYDARKICDLVKLNPSARASLLGSRSTATTYWIGLRKYLHRRWRSGEKALKYNRYLDYSDSKCLIVYKWDGGTRLYWRPCSGKSKFLCEDASSPQPSPSSTESQPSESIATTDNINFTEVETPTAGRKDARKPSINPAAGGFFGLGVGCVLLVLTVLIVVYLLRRQKKKRDGNHPIQLTSAAENITYGLAAHAQTESEACAVISDTKDVTPASSTVPTAIVSVHSDYISQINDEHEYNVLTTSNNSKVPMTHGNPYNHLSGVDGGNKYKADYDTANFVPETEVTTGLKNTVTHARLPGVLRGQVFEEEQYNVLGQHDSIRTGDAVDRVYDHLAADEGDYDTARWEKNVSEVDDSYSHTQRTTKPCKEDTYDVASKGQWERCADDTYNHDVKVEDDRGDTTDYNNTRGVLRGDGNLEGYLEGNDETDRRDQENVYSLAKDISDT